MFGFVLISWFRLFPKTGSRRKAPRQGTLKRQNKCDKFMPQGNFEHASLPTPF